MRTFLGLGAPAFLMVLGLVAVLGFLAAAGFLAILGLVAFFAAGFAAGFATFLAGLAVAAGAAAGLALAAGAGTAASTQPSLLLTLQPSAAKLCQCGCRLRLAEVGKRRCGYCQLCSPADACMTAFAYYKSLSLQVYAHWILAGWARSACVARPAFSYGYRHCGSCSRSLLPYCQTVRQGCHKTSANQHACDGGQALASMTLSKRREVCSPSVLGDAGFLAAGAFFDAFFGVFALAVFGFVACRAPRQASATDAHAYCVVL